MQRPREIFHAGPRDDNFGNLLRGRLCLARGIGARLSKRMIGMAAWYQLQGHIGDDIPIGAKVLEDNRPVAAAEQLTEPALHFEDSEFACVATHRGLYRTNTGHRRIPSVVLPRNAGICGLGQAANCGRGQTERMRGLLGG